MPLATSTTRQYRRWLARFQEFQATAAELPFSSQASAFLSTLPAGSAQIARCALKRHWPDAPWHLVPRPRSRRRVGQLARTVFGSDEVARLRAMALSLRERAVVECLWSLRRAEVAALTWGALDLGRGVVYVRGKGDKDAVALLVPEAIAALAAWFEASGAPPDAAPVFTGPAGRPIDPDTLEGWIRRALTRAGMLRPLRACHAFRRTFATRYLEANPDDLVGLKELLRHERLDTTLGYVYLRTSVLRPRLARMRL